MAIAGSSFAVILLSTAASFLIELNAFKARLLDEYRITTQMLANNLQAAVLLEDERDSSEIVRVARERSQTESAIVYLEDGRALASFFRDAPVSEEVPPVETETKISYSGILISEPILVEGREIVRVVLRANGDELKAFIIFRSLISLGLLMAALALAMLLATKHWAR